MKLHINVCLGALVLALWEPRCSGADAAFGGSSLGLPPPQLSAGLTGGSAGLPSGLPGLGGEPASPVAYVSLPTLPWVGTGAGTVAGAGLAGDPGAGTGTGGSAGTAGVLASGGGPSSVTSGVGSGAGGLPLGSTLFEGATGPDGSPGSLGGLGGLATSTNLADIAGFLPGGLASGGFAGSGPAETGSVSGGVAGAGTAGGGFTGAALAATGPAGNALLVPQWAAADGTLGAADGGPSVSTVGLAGVRGPPLPEASTGANAQQQAPCHCAGAPGVAGAGSSGVAGGRYAAAAGVPGYSAGGASYMAVGSSIVPVISSGGCQVSKVTVKQEHHSSAGPSFAQVTALYGDGALNQLQRRMATLTYVARTPFMCLDDRVTEPSLVTPGGDLGEFILALSTYLQERGAPEGAEPRQEVVHSLLSQYLEGLPTSRPMVHCTDDRALRHLEAELPAENLDLRAPAEHVKQAGLLQKIAEVENQGDSHVRLMLKQPEWFQLHELLVPLVLRSFYTLLWQQNQDPNSPLYHAPKLRLHVLSGTSNPQAFLEVTSSELCRGHGVAPMLTPRQGGRAVLVSHLDAVSERRAELAAFFARVANATPRKLDAKMLHQRLDRHGWLALETTGSRIASGLPFFTLTYT